MREFGYYDEVSISNFMVSHITCMVIVIHLIVLLYSNDD